MAAVNFLIKPVSCLCNMSCQYCFYKDVAENREKYSFGFMKVDCLEEIIRKGLDYASDECSFTFQGGEPTLAGLDFYRQVITFQKKYSRDGLRVVNAIQTNGYLIDEAWAAFLSENRFLVGISLDGPAEYHNRNRKDTAGKNTWNRVMHAINLFQKYHVSYNVLCVVTGEQAKSTDRLYHFFRKQNIHWLQFIPCMEPLFEERGRQKYHLSPEQYGDFLIRIFDQWYADLQKGLYISIRHLDNWISLLLGECPEACNMSGKCSVQFVIEANGNVYPCDFYVLDRWYLGNVHEETMQECISCRNAQEFVEVSMQLPQECKNCVWRGICRNGCRRDRISTNQEPNSIGRNYYCFSYRTFFEARWKELENAAVMILRMRKQMKHR